MLCVASLTQEEASPAEARTRIERSLYDDTVEKLEPAEAICVPETATVEAAIGTLRDRRVGCVLVTDPEERLAGIFTERDVLTRVAAEELDPAGVVLRDVMTPDPETIRPDHLLAHAFHLMMVNDLRHLPLVDDEGRPAGVVNSRDLIDYLATLVMG